MTHHCEPQIRVLDLAEYPLVATVDRQGRPEVSSTSPCPAVQARMLRDLADRVEQSGHACCTTPEPAPAPGPADAELFAAYADLPAAGPVWRGPYQAYDLGVGWLDRVGTEWSWAGTFDQSGTPVMRANGGQAAPQTLDVVDALYGPLSPVSSW